jgi:hypothetical protein
MTQGRFGFCREARRRGTSKNNPDENNQVLSGGIRMLLGTMQPAYRVQRTLSSFIFRRRQLQVGVAEFTLK